MKTVATPSRPTQRPPHSAVAAEGARIGDAARAARGPRRSRSRRPRRCWTSRPRGSIVEAVVLLLEDAGAHGGRRVLVDVVLVDGEDLGAGLGLLELEVAGRPELHRPVVVAVDQRVDLEVGVVEDVLLGLAAGAGSPTSRATARDGAAGVGLISEPLKGASSIELARRRGRTRWRSHQQVDPRVAGPPQVDPRGARVGGRHVGVARPEPAGSIRTRRWGRAPSARSRSPSRAAARR